MVRTLGTPKGRNWLYILMIYLSFLLLAFAFGSCKSRKVQKDYSKSLDKSEQITQVQKQTITKDTIQEKQYNNVKEYTERNNNLETEINTIINYDTLGRIKYAVINQKSKGQNRTKQDKLDKSIIGFDYGHSEITNLNSLGSKINDIKAISKSKSVDSKMDWLQIGVGAGVFILILFTVLFVYKRFK